MLAKMTRIESKPLRQAAQFERCTLNILGACTADTQTTVLAHLPDESHGMSRKADDLSACFACAGCHDVIDGRVPWPDEFERSYAEWYFRRAQTRTWRRLVELGVISIKGVQL